MKLKPPFIENILTPFTEGEKGISIPFNVNQLTEIDKISNEAAIIIRDTISNAEIFVSQEGSVNKSDGIITFSIEGEQLKKFQSGKYYKIQVAFINNVNKDIGYYSSIGIARYIKKPELKLNGVDEEQNIGSFTKPSYAYVGECILHEPTEKVATYSFTLFDNNNNIVFTTGEKIHDSSKDELSNKSVDTCLLPNVLNLNELYTLVYKITTINGYSTSTPQKYRNVDTINLSMGNNVFIAEPDCENGTIILKMQRKNNKKDFTPLNYNFILLRASSKDNYQSWDRITNFSEDDSKNIFSFQDSFLLDGYNILWEDFTVEHGISYKYALQAYNSHGLLSNRLESNLTLKTTKDGLPQYDENGNLQYVSIATSIVFDDMFLSDGKRQLCIRFNPQVSTFKNTILENKVDTIGSQYPFFFRNGTVNYKEFSISGLISLLMDPSDKFKIGLYNIKNKETAIIEDFKTNLSDENIKNEREFKLEVLNWLTNGEPKIFRSPTEGNYIIRLMNTSLSPNVTLGRMLHSFSSTAYEIDSYNLESLSKYGLIEFNMPKYKKGSFIGEVTMKLSDHIEKENSPIIKIPHGFKVIIHDSKPYGAIYNIRFNTGDSVEIQPGLNGIYEILDDREVVSISWANWSELKQKYLNSYYQEDSSCKIFYCYYDSVNLTNFHFIKDIKYIPAMVQHIGELCFKDPMNFEHWETNKQGTLMPPVSSIATWGVREIGNIDWIRIKRRPIIPLYKKGDEYYFNQACTQLFSTDHELFLIQGLYLLNDNNLIRDYSQTNGKNYVEFNKDEKGLFTYNFNGEDFTLDEANIQGDIKDITKNYCSTQFELDTTLLQKISLDTLKLGRGLMLEMIYVLKEFDYDFTNYKNQINSDTYNKYDQEKESFADAEKSWIEFLKQPHTKMEFLEYKNTYEEQYLNYSKSLMEVVLELTQNEVVTIE